MLASQPVSRLAEPESSKALRNACETNGLNSCPGGLAQASQLGCIDVGETAENAQLHLGKESFESNLVGITAGSCGGLGAADRPRNHRPARRRGTRSPAERADPPPI